MVILEFGLNNICQVGVPRLYRLERGGSFREICLSGFLGEAKGCLTHRFLVAIHLAVVGIGRAIIKCAEASFFEDMTALFQMLVQVFAH